MAKIEQIGTTEILKIPGIPVLAIGLDNNREVIDLCFFDSQMRGVTGGLNLVDDPSGLTISQIKFTVCENGRPVLYGFPEQVLFRTFVDTYKQLASGSIRSIGHIRVVTRPESVEHRIMGASAEVLQSVGFVSPGNSERFRQGRLRQELGAHFIFDDWVVGKNEPRFRLSVLRRLPHF